MARYSRRRRSFTARPIVQSFKQISVDGPASRSAATNILHTAAVGVDNYAGPTANNNEVPTGAKIFNIIVFLSLGSIVSPATVVHFTFQCLRSGQGQVVPGVQGGNPQRNQVIHTEQFFVTAQQSINRTLLVKVPKQYQRIREGDILQLVYRGDTTFTSITQVLYKFYR